jgi:ankyrin repeat protein/glyoxylase-like metal-dependent hydrolase (beta-lactamase superfamily II)
MRKQFVLLFALFSTAFAATIGAGGLIDAVKRGDTAAVAALLNQGVDVNKPDPDGTTALHWAAHRSDLKTAELLLGAGANAAAVNAYGATAISEAAAEGAAEMIARLLDAGADANTASPEGETVLMTAARAGNAEAVRKLVQRGAVVDAREKWKGQTALMWASAGNHAEAAKILIESGAGVNARSTVWPEEVKRPSNGNLVSKRPKGGLTPLLYAAREGAIDAARVLVKAGANLNITEPDGITPSIMAVINGHYDVAAFLLEAGANPNLADRWGRTVLYAAVDMHSLQPSATRPAPRIADKRNGLDVARLALEHGASPNPQLVDALPGRSLSDDPDPVLRAGATPFIRAAKTGDAAAMQLLLEHGADPKIATKDHTTALMVAAGIGWRFGDAPIPEANVLESARLCVKLGLDVNAVNEKGQAAIHGAADRGAERIIEFLADNGANMDVKDQKGMTPLILAAGSDKDGYGHPGFPRAEALLRKLVPGVAPMTPAVAAAPIGAARRLKDGLYVIEAPLNGAEGPNIAIYVTSEGVVVVDDWFDQSYEQVAARVKAVTDQPIRYVVKTHSHADNTGAFRKLLPSVNTISTATARKHMVDAKMAAPPPLTFSGEASLFLGGKEIRLLHAGRAHTDGDAVVYFPAERALYVGDLMSATNGVSNPAVDYRSGGSLEQWPSTLDRILKLDIDIVIPGTGFGATNKAALVAHRKKVETVRNRVSGMVHDDKSKDEVSQVLISEFDFKPVNLHALDGMMVEFKK